MGGRNSKGAKASTKAAKQPSSSPGVQAKAIAEVALVKPPEEFYVDKGQSAAFPLCGVSVDYVRDLIERGTLEEDWNIAMVVDNFVKPQTIQRRSSFVEHLCRSRELEKHVKPKADFFLSYAWSYKIGELLSALENRKGLFMWMDCFVVNQHDSGVKDLDTWLKTFGSAVQSVGLIVPVLIPWDAPVPCTRSWCTFELYVAAKYGVKTECEVSANDRNIVSQALADNDLQGADMNNIFSGIDVENAKAFKQADQEAILTMIRAEGPAKVNDMVSKPLKQWLLGLAEANVVEAQREVDLMAADVEEDTKHNLYSRLASSQMQVAEVLSFMGEITKSLEQHQIAYATLQKAGRSKLEMAIQANNLGFIFKHNERFEEALKLYRESARLHEELMQPGQVSHDYLQVRNNTAVLLLNQGDVEEALEIEKFVLGTYRQAGAGFEASVAQCLSTTGCCLLELGKLEDAERDLEESLKIGIEIWGDNSLNIAGKQTNLAKVLVRKQSSSDFERALELGEASYKLCRRVLMEEHLMTGMALMVKAYALWRMNKWDEAEVLAKRGIACAVGQVGADDGGVMKLEKEWASFKNDFPRPVSN